MALNLAKRTETNALMVLASTQDPAIDWDKTEIEGATHEAKRLRYLLEIRDPSKLVLVEGQELTYFLFKHPRRADVQERFHNLQFALEANRGTYSSMTFGAVDAFLVGMKVGLNGQIEQAPRDKDGKLTPDFVQCLVDQDLVNELSAQYMTELRKPIETNEKK